MTTPLPQGRDEYLESLNTFTPRAQQALALARTESARLHHHFVGTEHVLLGLIRLGQGVAVNVLQGLGLDLETARREVEKNVGTGPEQKIIGSIPLTPRVKKVLVLAAKEAKALHHTYVGTEHILLGLLSEGDGVAARVLRNLEVDIEHTRQEILRELDPNLSRTAEDTAIPQNSKSPEFQSDSVDVSKRYDVYCREQDHAVVYRNALFKGIKTLFQKGQFDAFSEFMELEQADGQTIFVARSSVIKFCEHGVQPGSDTVSGGEKVDPA